MAVISIISDWEKNDFYLAAIKGKILSNNKNTSIIEISNKISKFNNIETAFIIKNSYKNFPTQTINLICVNTLQDKENNFLLIVNDNQYFIGPDNGIFSLIFDKKPEKIIKLPFKKTTFPELDIFTEVANKIINNTNIMLLGDETDNYKLKSSSDFIHEEDLLTLKIIYFDSYNNAILNINKNDFSQIINNQDFEIIVSSFKNKITKISNNYFDVPEFELFAIFNSINLLEIGIINGNIKQLFELNINDEIIIKFGKNIKSANTIQLL